MSYQIVEYISLFKSIIYTKMTFKNARLIRYPSVVRGKKFIKVGDGFTTGYNCRIDAMQVGQTPPKLSIGKNVQLNDNVHIACVANIIIADDVLIASRVFITDHNHGSFPHELELDLAPAHRKITSQKVIIDSKVWLGEGVVVLPGVHIGKNAIVGANAVVTKSVPENTIVAGNPARIIKTYDTETKSWVPYAS
jgi:lipopolysaccharide O-acetyltransferase